MPDEVVGDDTCADPADPHDQDDAAPDRSPEWNVRQTVAWIIWRRLPPPEVLRVLDATFDYDEATSEAKDLNKEVTTALDALNHAVMADRIVARARPSRSPTTPNEHWPRGPIPANTIDELRRIDMLGWCQ